MDRRVMTGEQYDQRRAAYRRQARVELALWIVGAIVVVLVLSGVLAEAIVMVTT